MIGRRTIQCVNATWGRLVLLGNNQLQTPRVYAGVVLLTLMAVALFALVALGERVACPWNRKETPA